MVLRLPSYQMKIRLLSLTAKMLLMAWLQSLIRAIRKHDFTVRPQSSFKECVPNRQTRTVIKYRISPPSFSSNELYIEQHRRSVTAF